MLHMNTLRFEFNPVSQPKAFIEMKIRTLITTYLQLVYTKVSVASDSPSFTHVRSVRASCWSKVYPRNAGREVGMDPGWDTNHCDQLLFYLACVYGQEPRGHGERESLRNPGLHHCTKNSSRHLSKPRSIWNPGLLYGSI